LKKLLLLPYSITRWLIIITIFLTILLLTVIEAPNIVLKLASQPLKEQGITYKSIKGGILSGFRLTRVNYQNKIKAKEVSLKVDWEKLKNRVIYINQIKLEDLEIDKDYLSSLINSDSSDENNSSLAFDKLILNNTDISIKNLIYDKYRINSAKLHIKHFVTDMKKQYRGDIKLELNSNVGKINLNAIIRDDFVKLTSNMKIEKNFIQPYLNDKNITLTNNPEFILKADGTIKKVNYHLTTKRLEIKQNSYRIESKKLILIGDYTQNQNINAKLDTILDGNMAYLKLKGDTKLNLKDLNKTLKFNLKANLLLNKNFVESQIPDKNLSIENIAPIDIEAKGNLKKTIFKINHNGLKIQYNRLLLNIPSMLLQGDINLSNGAKLTIQTHTQLNIKRNKIVSNLILSTTPIEFDIPNHRTKGSLKLINSSKNMKFDIRSRFDGDYTDPKKIETQTEANIKKFNLFDINLNPIVPLRLDIKNSLLGAKAIINSERIKLHATTLDYDHIKFHLKTRNLYLYKIVELPDELQHKFVKLDLKGDATISKQYGNIEGYIYSNKKFKAKLDIHNNKSGLNANIATQHLKLKAKGNINKKDIKAQIDIDSLKELQQELTKLYPFKKFDIDGSLKFNTKLKGEQIWMESSSPKLKLNGFSIESLDIDADYNNKLITLNKFNFKTTGFKDKRQNKEVYLNKKGKIYLGENKKIDINMHPNIRIKANGNNNKLDGKVVIKQLPLGHPDYGSMFFNCNINYQQRGLNKSIIGTISMKEMKLFYQAKFLDVDYDPDIVVITKRDKKRKLKSEDNSFLNHTKIDVTIQASQAIYKTPDIDLIFDIDLKADKQYGKDLALLGKIKDINGHFDQIPKRFEIEHSNIVFKGGKKINPLLDIKVKYELPQVIIHIDIGGDANRPKLEFSSEPPMPKKDIMSYLLLGISTSNLSNGNGSLGREAELFIINQAARDLAYEFELDRVFVKDDGTGEGYAIEVGKKISKKNMLIIENSTQGNSFILEHNINKNIKVKIGQHQKEHPSQSIDIYFQKRFK